MTNNCKLDLISVMNTNTSWQAVVFDFDGTLAELHIDFKAMRSGIDTLAAGFDLHPEEFSHLYILEMIESAGRKLNDTSPGRGELFVQEAMSIIEDREIKAARRSSLFPGAKEMLLKLSRLDVTIGIITRNCLQAVSTVFPDYNQYVNALLSREMTNFVKPDPRHLLEILVLLKASPAQTLMVGDHPIDVRIGRDVGTATAAVLTGTGSEEDLRQAQPDFILFRVQEVFDLVVNHHRSG